MKDEHLYIDEFLTYYLYGIKVDKIYIYDNSDDNNLNNYHSRYTGRVDVKHIPGKAKKFDAYNDFLARMNALPVEERPRWVFFPDTDEFLVLTPEREIHEYLASECKEGGINIYWYIFGSNGRKNYSPEPVTARFTKRAKDRHPLYKTIAVLEDIESITHPHDYNYKPGRSARFVENARIHHYFGKSLEEYTKKQKKGRDDTGEIRPDTDFQMHDLNEVDDSLADRIYRRAQKEYKMLSG